MDSIILSNLLSQRISAEQFQLWGIDIHWMSEEFDTPENRAIVADVIANYATLEAEYLTEQEAIKISDQAKTDLVDIDINSVRSIREWLVTQPGAPQYLVDYEADAIEKRKKVK